MNIEEYIAFCIVSKICGWKGYIVLRKQMSFKDVFMTILTEFTFHDSPVVLDLKWMGR